MQPNILNNIKRIKALAETGLLFTQNEYDIDRYNELKEISLQLMEEISDTPVEQLKMAFTPANDYPTPKIDVRGVVLNENGEILLVKEKMDGKWTIPGGWCEIGLSPNENLIKEMKEETGLNVTIERLLAIFDKKCHPHPPQPLYVYKLVFFCTINGSKTLNPDYEIADIGYFNMDNLPTLSEDRIVKNQLEIAHQKVINNNFDVYFD